MITKNIEVFEAGSVLAINGGNTTGIVEQAVIGDKGTVKYQLIVYVPERHPQVVNDYEVSPVEGKATKTTIGFAQTPVEIQAKEVNILLDGDSGFVGASSSSPEILVSTIVLSAEEIAQYKEQQVEMLEEEVDISNEEENGKKEE